MFYSKNGKSIAAVVVSVLSGFSVITHAVPLTGGVDVGAEAICDVRSGVNSVGSEDPQEATCTALGGDSKASANLPKAEVKVLSTIAVETPEFLGIVSEAAFVDFITVTEGWDANGELTGTFQLDVEGMVDTSIIENDNEINFVIVVWYPSDPTPPCIDSAYNCGFGEEDLFFPGPNPFYPCDYAELDVDVNKFQDTQVDAMIFSG
jgi:hypothetical protein